MRKLEITLVDGCKVIISDTTEMSQIEKCQQNIGNPDMYWRITGYWWGGTKALTEAVGMRSTIINRDTLILYLNEVKTIEYVNHHY